MAKGAKPFKYRGRWRAQTTLDNGTRPCDDFDKYDDAVQWLAEQLANANSEHLPELGGPKQATLAQALAHYAGLNTITKGGYAAELVRINHYLSAAGLKQLRVVVREGKRELVEKDNKPMPSAFEAHRANRLGQRQETYKFIEALAVRRCSTLCTADFRRLMVSMEKEGLSPSTIQKEIALLKHLFNIAVKEWNWRGFENPCIGLRLGTSNQRFVFMTSQQQVALRAALAQCDSPYFWSLVEICLQTTLRRGSLLAMTRSNVDLEGRVAMLPSKTGVVAVPLSNKAVQLLRDLPVHPSGKYFPMTGNAVDMAWEGVRTKIGMPELQFKDLRHIGATAYARLGANSHQLQKILSHKSTRMAEIYVNLVNSDALSFMDSIEPSQTVYEVPEPAKGSEKEILNRNRTKRLTAALVQTIKGTLPAVPSAKAPDEAPGPAVSDATQHFLAHHAGPCESHPQPQSLDDKGVEAAFATDCTGQGKDHESAPADTSTSGPTDSSAPVAHAAAEAPELHQATGTHEASGVVARPCVSNNVVRVDFKRRG